MDADAEAVQRLIGEARERCDCVVAAPCDLPSVAWSLPPDLVGFYELCGGLVFRDWSFEIAVVAPARLVPTDLVLYGEPTDKPITHAWHVIAEAGESGGVERISIDLHRARLGRCYNSFWRYANPGDMDVVARSFTELLARLLHESGPDPEDGPVPFWLGDDFEPLGDAFD